MTRCNSAIALAATILSVGSIARAQEGSTDGFAFGLRLGYALPMGTEGRIAVQGTTATGSNSLSDDFKGMIPIIIDAGYRINPSIYVGAFFQYGFMSINTDNSSNYSCTTGIDCSAHDIQIGANLHYHILPAASFDPWVGIGVGYEWVGLSAKGTVSVLGTSFSVDESIRVHGFQFLNLQAGGDFRATPDFGVGPFISLSLGQYSSYSTTVNVANTTTTTSGDMTDKGLHEWLTIGVRGQYNL